MSDFKFGTWYPIDTAPTDGSFNIYYRPLAHRTNDYAIAIKSAKAENFCWTQTVPDGESPKNPTNGA